MDPTTAPFFLAFLDFLRDARRRDDERLLLRDRRRGALGVLARRADERLVDRLEERRLLDLGVRDFRDAERLRLALGALALRRARRLRELFLEEASLSLVTDFLGALGVRAFFEL